jgi:hypothetical protein
VYIPAEIQQPLKTYVAGNYVVHPDYKDNQLLRIWIQQLHFTDYEAASNQMSQHARQRNFLYHFVLDAVGKEVILKVSDHSQYQKWYRRLNQWLVSPFKNYSLSAYYGSIGLQKINIDSIKVIAYWTQIDNSKKSYLLYEKVNASMTVADLCTKINAEHPQALSIIQAVAQRLANITRTLHAHNMRHGDPHAGNFLLTTAVPDITELTVERIAELNFTLIDLDKTCFSRQQKGTLKALADLRDLRRFRVANIEGVDCLQYYLGKTPSNMQKAALKFWMRGGFNVYKWFKKGSKRK